MRGEHRQGRTNIIDLDGSSPHARGALPATIPVRRPTRLIPACAGSTDRHDQRHVLSPAHPRMRGEHISSFCPLPFNGGSSPHARGALSIIEVRVDDQGLIPACAGSTRLTTTASNLTTAHPRMRGEHGHRKRNEISTGGSSPHARGAQRDVVSVVGAGGLIPACAGSTCRSRRTLCGTRAHPRMRGEHPAPVVPRRIRKGSSPHARGALSIIEIWVDDQGLIPACAGSTHPPGHHAQPPKAHPRMRGEHMSDCPARRCARGSSPHARGARPGPVLLG